MEDEQEDCPGIDSVTFGEWCAIKRKRLRLSQTEVGAAICYSQRIISDVETEKPGLWECKKKLRDFYMNYS
jgi:hypothetical protein